MERSYDLAGVLCILIGYPFLGLFFLWIGSHVDEEERAIEEQLLDASVPTVPFALNVQRDIAAEYFASKGSLYGTDSERNVEFVENYLYEEMLWERDLLEEIYEVPASIIISNSYYLVPNSEEPFFLSFLYACDLESRKAWKRTKEKEFLSQKFSLKFNDPSKNQEVSIKEFGIPIMRKQMNKFYYHHFDINAYDDLEDAWDIYNRSSASLEDMDDATMEKEAMDMEPSSEAMQENFFLKMWETNYNSLLSPEEIVGYYHPLPDDALFYDLFLGKDNFWIEAMVGPSSPLRVTPEVQLGIGFRIQEAFSDKTDSRADLMASADLSDPKADSQDPQAKTT